MKIDLSRKTKDDAKILQELEQRFLNKEWLGVEDVLKQYCKYDSEIKYIRAKAIVKGWLAGTLRKRLYDKHGEYLVCLERKDWAGKKYGLAEKEEEVVRYNNFRHTHLKGGFSNSDKLRLTAKRKNILPQIIREERVSLSTMGVHSQRRLK